MEDAPIIRERLCELFKLSGAANVTQFAKMLGMNRQSVDRYLNSERNPDAPSIIQICEKMNVSADWILGRSDIRSSSVELQTAVKYTGLLEETISEITNYNFDQKAALMDLVDSNLFPDLLTNYAMFRHLLAHLPDWEQLKEDANSTTVVDGKMVMPFYVAMDLWSSKVGNMLTDICSQRKREKFIEIRDYLRSTAPRNEAQEEGDTDNE